VKDLPARIAAVEDVVEIAAGSQASGARQRRIVAAKRGGASEN
jgi:hypothetical protein